VFTKKEVRNGIFFLTDLSKRLKGLICMFLQNRSEAGPQKG
jgi:hypothetical protein